MKGLASWITIVGLALGPAAGALAADRVELALAGTRSHFTTHEPVEFALVYRNDGGNAKTIPLEIKHADGGTLTFQVPVAIAAGKAQTRLVSLVGEALKPGQYSARAGAAAKAVKFSVHHGYHSNAYWIGQWCHHGETPGTIRAKGGWMYMNSDLATLHPRKPAANDRAEDYIAARMKPFARMVLGGGHQLDLDLQNDWGDPWVQRTIIWRMQLAALSNRIYPIAGSHCYDEPGLTWWPTQAVQGHKADTNPFSIPHQLDEFTRKTCKKIPAGPFSFTGPQYAGMMDTWLDFMDIRMKYLEQAWHATVWGTGSAEPKFATINQVSSSYSPGNPTDGVDSRQNRPYAIVSGHGGYSDLPFGTMQPVRSAEAFRGLGYQAHYFLPMWYTHSWATIRNAVWMPWTTKLEGIMYTPEQDFGLNNEKYGYLGSHTVFEIAEINRRLALVGGVMNQLPKTPAPVAMLHSHTQVAHDIATVNSPKLTTVGAPQYASAHNAAVDACFFRVLETGMAPNWIDEVEAVEKGPKFLTQWKVIFCPALATARPAFRKVLEGYVAGGGKLIQFQGDRFRIKGSIVAKHAFGNPSKHYAEDIKEITSPAYRDLAWRKWNNDFAPTFAKDLAGWIGVQPYECGNKEVLLGVHKAGKAMYLLFANNAQDKANPRGVKHELVAAETSVKVPAGGVVYDLFNGGKVPVKDGKAKLQLAAGDGACWVHLPAAPGKLKLGTFTGNQFMDHPKPVMIHNTLHLVDVRWGNAGPLPFRLRLFDPAGRMVHELYQATRPQGGRPYFWSTMFSFGANPAPGTWTYEVYEWLTGSTTVDRGGKVKPIQKAHQATVATGPVSVYFDDAARIQDLLAGKAEEPEYKKLNWDAKRVFALNPKKFAVFGPAAAAQKIAAALKAKGMTVEINPKYEIKPFQREPGRGGAGVSHGVNSNLENIFAHTIVLPGHPLAAQSANRGHIHREVTATFPGSGRAYVQWGIGCYQPCWQNIFVLGDPEAGVAWLLKAIVGKARTSAIPLEGTVKLVKAAKQSLPGSFKVTQEIKTYDTPVGVASSLDSKLTYVALHDGSVAAYDQAGQRLWRTKALLEGCALAVSPTGERLAVAGYPGLLVLDAKRGKVLGGHRAAAADKGTFFGKRMTCVAFNDKGTQVAGGWWSFDGKETENLVVLDAQGKTLALPRGFAGNVMGVAFVPGGNLLLAGGDQLTAVKPSDGTIVWRNALGGAQAFAFSGDGKVGAAGGWGKNAGKFNVADGKISQSAVFEAVVGGVALLPKGDLAVAVWGGTHPLYVLRGNAKKPETLFASRFGFQNVVWSPAHQGLLAAEQGGKLWLLSAAGKPQALLDDAGTTIYRMEVRATDVLLARMNRTVQRITAKK